jgi:hypothetical protein
MIIGEGFLEALERLLKPNMLLTYTTVEPPVFKGHIRPGKVLIDLGSSFDNFDYFNFNAYVSANNHNDTLYDGAAFFMSGYKKMFEDVGFFDGFSFVPCFCEDDDFLIRAKLKGYELKTCDSAISYHFVSQTSRFSDEMKDKRGVIEMYSNRNFVRKWGVMISTFNHLNYQVQDNFEFNKIKISIELNDNKYLPILEPFFEKIVTNESPEEYITSEQLTTRYDIKSKFEDVLNVDAKITYETELTNDDVNMLMNLRIDLPKYEKGIYQIGNLIINII